MVMCILGFAKFCNKYVKSHRVPQLHQKYLFEFILRFHAKTKLSRNQKYKEFNQTSAFAIFGHESKISLQ